MGQLNTSTHTGGGIRPLIELKDRWIIFLVLSLFLIANHAGAVSAAALGGLLLTIGHRIPHIKKWAWPIWPSLAFLAWILLSSLWTPYESPQSLSGHTRFAIAAILYGLFIYNMQRQSEKNKNLARLILTCIIPLSAIFFAADFMTGYKITRVFDPQNYKLNILQNLSRGLSALLVCMPAYLILKIDKTAPQKTLVALSTLALAIAAITSSTSASVLAISSIIPLLVLGYKYPKPTLRIVSIIGISLIIFAPLIGLITSKISPELKASIPHSWEHRIYIWGYVSDHIQDHFLIGNGFDGVRTMKETYMSRGTEMPYISLHPHNMGLHIWIELGVIGALLFSGVLWSIQSALGNSKWLTPKRASAISATLFIAIIFSSISYSAWSIWWWGAIAIAFALCTLIPSDA